MDEYDDAHKMPYKAADEPKALAISFAARERLRLMISEAKGALGACQRQLRMFKQTSLHPTKIIDYLRSPLTLSSTSA